MGGATQNVEEGVPADERTADEGSVVVDDVSAEAAGTAGATGAVASGSTSP